MGKHDFIDRHYRESRDVLAELLGAELHEACVRFPPSLEDGSWDNEAFERRFRRALPELPAPDAAMVTLLCAFLDLEIDHEVEQIDQQVKGGAVQRACPSALHVETFYFLWQWLMLALEERSSQMVAGFKREDKHRVVASLRKRVELMQHGNVQLH